MVLANLILVQIWTAVVNGISCKVCDVYDGVHGIPVGAGRTCTVLKDDTCGSFYSYKTTNLHCDHVYSKCNPDPSCPGFVGMNLTYTDCTDTKMGHISI